MPMPPLRPLLVRDVAEFHVRIARRPALLKPDAGQGDDEGAPQRKDASIPPSRQFCQVKSSQRAYRVTSTRGRSSWSHASTGSGSAVTDAVGLAPSLLPRPGAVAITVTTTALAGEWCGVVRRVRPGVRVWSGA